jgi:hypothetical protein
MPWKNVCYAGWGFSDGVAGTNQARYDIDTMLNTMIDKGVTHIIFEFLILNRNITYAYGSTVPIPPYSLQVSNSVLSWLARDQVTTVTYNTNPVVYWGPFNSATCVTDKETYRKKMNDNNIKLLISLGGATSFNNGPGQKAFSGVWRDSFSPYYAGENRSDGDIIVSANKLAADLVKILYNQMVDGIDMDVENIEQDKTFCHESAVFLGAMSSYFKKQKTGDDGDYFIVTHAPQTPYFNTEWFDLYYDVYKFNGADIDFFNIQYYNNNSDYALGDDMFKDDESLNASVLELIENGIPSDKIVAGLAVSGQEVVDSVNNTYINWPGDSFSTFGIDEAIDNWGEAANNFIRCKTSDLSTYGSTELNEWFSNGSSGGGAMMWLYNTEDVNTTNSSQNSIQYMQAYFGNINASIGDVVVSDKILVSPDPCEIGSELTYSNVPAGTVYLANYPPDNIVFELPDPSTGTANKYTWTVAPETTLSDGGVISAGTYIITTAGYGIHSDPFTLTGGTYIDPTILVSPDPCEIGSELTYSNVPAGPVYLANYPIDNIVFELPDPSTGTANKYTWTVAPETTLSDGGVISAGTYIITTAGYGIHSDPFEIT